MSIGEIASSIVNAGSTPVSWFYGMFGFSIGTALMPMIKKTINKVISDAFKKFINGELSVMNNVKDADLREVMTHLSIYIKKNGIPQIEKELNRISGLAEVTIHNPLATEIIEEIHKDLDDGLKLVKPQDSATVMMGQPD